MCNKTGATHGEQVVRKCKNCKKHLGNSQTRTPLLARHGHSMVPKTVQKKSFFPTHCFFNTFPGICRKAFLGPRSLSKGPNHALEKVLTKETPSFCLQVFCQSWMFQTWRRSISVAEVNFFVVNPRFVVDVLFTFIAFDVLHAGSCCNVTPTLSTAIFAAKNFYGVAESKYTFLPLVLVRLHRTRMSVSRCGKVCMNFCMRQKGLKGIACSVS